MDKLAEFMNNIAQTLLARDLTPTPERVMAVLMACANERMECARRRKIQKHGICSVSGVRLPRDPPPDPGLEAVVDRFGFIDR